MVGGTRGNSCVTGLLSPSEDAQKGGRMSISQYQIVDGPSLYGIIEAFITANEPNLRSTFEFVLEPQPDGSKVKVNMKMTRRFRLTALEYESGGNPPQLNIKGVLLNTGGRNQPFTGYYHTGKRVGSLTLNN